MNKVDSLPRPERALRRTLLAASGALSLSAFGVRPATAANAAYPGKPIRMIHAFAVGSGTDNAGRLIAERLTQKLGQPVVVENRPGANMIIGTEYAARQPADGYTMLIVTLDNLGINPNLYRNPGYSAKDFDPITLIGMLPLVLVAASGRAYSSLAELKQAYEKTKQPLSFGTWGVGSVAHMVGAMIQIETGIPFNFVPFQGAAPAVTAILGGHIDLTISSAVTSASHIKAGKVRPLAIGGQARHADLPDVPTFAELGYRNINAVQWHGIAVRAGGQREIVDRLYKEIRGILDEPDSQPKILKVGYSGIDGRTPAEFASFIAAETQAWSRVVKTLGVVVDR